MLWWILACTIVDEPTVQPRGDSDVLTGTVDTGTTSDTAMTSDTTGDTGATGHTGDTAVPMVDEALVDRCTVDIDKEEPRAPNLSRLVLSEGRCNDGTPPTAYLRAATDPAHQNEWLFYFEGGYSCGTGESCSIRWCGEDFHDAQKMSSTWSTEGKRKDGLLSVDAANDFAGWNIVFMPYCSSDEWAGTRSDVVLTNDDGVRFRVHFEGARIVDGLIDALEVGVSSDDGLEVLPPLADAERVVLSGGSGGAKGVMHNLDALAERLAPIEVVGLLEGATMPTDPYLTTAQIDLVNDYNASTYGAAHTAWGSRLDESCVTDNPLEPWRCIEPRVLQHESLSTPFFLHHDLRDRVLIDVFDMVAGIDGATFATGSKRALEDLGAARPEVGVHGSVCAEHVSFLNSRLMQDQFLPVDGVDMSLHDAIVRWLDGHAVVAVDDPATPISTCP